MNSITLKILLFSISFVILFFNPTIAFIFWFCLILLFILLTNARTSKKLLMEIVGTMTRHNPTTLPIPFSHLEFQITPIGD